MRVLIFQAATSAVAIAAMTRFADDLRKAGHSGGLRNLARFRREKEPADRILVALKPSEAEQYKSLGAELVATFQDTDRIIPVELPEDDEELKDFEFDSAISELDDEGSAMTMDQLRAEAIERAIEVRPDSTRDELEHALDLDQHPGAQAGDRLTDRQLMGDGTLVGGYTEDRIGMRTSTVLPTANGLDLERMNDEQLQATAKELGITVPRNARRATVINKITEVYAEKVGAPKDAAPPSPAESFDNDLTDDLDAEALMQIAEKEGVDIGRATAADTIRSKIVEAREAKAKESGGSNG